MYLHMIVPSLSNVNKEDHNNIIFNNTEQQTVNNDKKVFYEVGCKIFEINKIYK
jgi:hypothetical protein